MNKIQFLNAIAQTIVYKKAEVLQLLELWGFEAYKPTNKEMMQYLLSLFNSSEEFNYEFAELMLRKPQTKNSTDFSNFDFDDEEEEPMDFGNEKSGGGGFLGGLFGGGGDSSGSSGGGGFLGGLFGGGSSGGSDDKKGIGIMDMINVTGAIGKLFGGKKDQMRADAENEAKLLDLMMLAEKNKAAQPSNNNQMYIIAGAVVVVMIILIIVMVSMKNKREAALLLAK